MWGAKSIKVVEWMWSESELKWSRSGELNDNFSESGRDYKWNEINDNFV